MTIQPIVEGQGDEAAVPLLLRRLRDEAQAWGLEVGRPHRKRRTQLVKKDSLQSAVRVAALREDCAGILVLFDADDDCPEGVGADTRTMGAGSSRRKALRRGHGEPRVRGVVSRKHRSAARERPRSCPMRPRIADPEAPRDAKGELERRMPRGAQLSPHGRPGGINGASRPGEHVPALPQLSQAGERLRCACRSCWRGPCGVAARSVGFVK